MTRAIILVADGLGIGSAPDAEEFGDEGANTLLHIIEYIKKNRSRPLFLPNLTRLGLLAACEQANDVKIESTLTSEFMGAYGFMEEISSGKDTPSGHWEMAGVPVLFDWGYFHDKNDSFPPEFIRRLCAKTGVSGILANRHAPGTDVLDWFGEEHIQSQMPICYTSVDSVFQVAAHEEHFGLERLYEFCQVARELLDEYNIGRVIARPFVGETPDEFTRTGNRRDFSVLPPSKTVLDKLHDAGGQVISIGKIADIYAHQGISESIKATGLEALINKSIEQLEQDSDNTLIFTNLVNFDQDFGHRRDIEGYAEALEYFDGRLSEVFDAMREDDVLYITADHGCDPSWPGTDHTREFVPIIAYRKGLQGVDLGHRSTFADLGQTLAEQFGLERMQYGHSFYSSIIHLS